MNLENETPQIARSESFASANEPTITIRRDKVKYSAACLKQLPNTDYIHFAVYPNNKVLCAVPVGADEKHGIRWSSYAGKRKPKDITCKDFAGKLYRLMEWNPDNRYKIIGKVAVDTDGQKIIAFDLVEAMIFAPNATGNMPRTPSPPSEWDDSFGAPADELTNNPLVRRFTEDAEITIGKEI
jgi:hypothetical protein